jgi:hypothetical protein
MDVGASIADEQAVIVVALCTQASSQRIVINEVGPDRKVTLGAAGKCLGPSAGSVVIQQMPLALRPCDNSDSQKFILDGDSIISATDPDLVVEVRNNGGGLARTQLWFGHRDLNDPEFWSIVPAGGTATPTSGFVRVPEDVPDLGTALTNATAGSVIQLNTDVTVSENQHLTINPGVTLRGGRQNIALGPEVFAPVEDNNGLFVMNGEFARITGLRIRGPSRALHDVAQAVGIFVKDDVHAIIDHNDLSDWPHAAVEVRGARDEDCPETLDRNGIWVPEPWGACCARNRDHRPPSFRVRVVRNFIHHNRLQDRGYGVVSYSGAYPSIEGNTFTQNRHAIAADGKPFTGYQAVLNFVLSSVPLQQRIWGTINWHTQDFDMHGRAPHNSYMGSAGGNHIKILRNTFLGTNNGSLPISDHPNIHIRGTPCDFAHIGENISLESSGDAIEYEGEEKDLKVQLEGNVFNHANPTTRLGVGDFDGDGFDDLFIATGTAWYFAPRGTAEWRLLRAETTTNDKFLFGDFDGDGRADVFTQRGSDWLVSWGGISDWEKIASHPEPMSEYRIGHFFDAQRSDIFFASGTEWLVSAGATGPFERLALASERSAQIRLGDFNGDGKTDVLIPTLDGWTIFDTATGNRGTFHRRDSIRHPVSVVADFDGDGLADVTSNTSAHGPHMQAVRWVFVPRAGLGPWTTIATQKYGIGNAPAMGRFRDQRRVDILAWTGTHLSTISTVPVNPTTLSRQDMR